MENYINEIICGDNIRVLKDIPCNSVDLTVTSPPYDNLRTYNGFEWDFEGLAKELFRVTKEGGVVVWVVNDATVRGSETGTSFRQALYFRDECGFNLHDTMIYAKHDYMPLTHNRYEQQFEYMFVFSKGKPKTFNPIKIPTLHAGQKNTTSHRRFSDDITKGGGYSKEVKKEKIKPNIWFYNVGKNKTTKDAYAHQHPAIFPEKLAEDHITSWTNPGDIVLDPFIGSGTTAKMAALNGRKYIGIDISEEYCEIARRRVSEASV